MSNSPDVVNYYIPLMKDLNMTWEEIKNTPRYELQALIVALNEFNILHSFDGYSDKDVQEMAKNNPEVVSYYSDYKARQRKYSNKKSAQISSFGELM